jgi:hypothetical protein
VVTAGGRTPIWPEQGRRRPTLGGRPQASKIGTFPDAWSGALVGPLGKHGTRKRGLAMRTHDLPCRRFGAPIGQSAASTADRDPPERSDAASVAEQASHVQGNKEKGSHRHRRTTRLRSRRGGLTRPRRPSQVHLTVLMAGGSGTFRFLKASELQQGATRRTAAQQT